jgi:hypothetical protein
MEENVDTLKPDGIKKPTPGGDPRQKHAHIPPERQMTTKTGEQDGRHIEAEQFPHELDIESASAKKNVKLLAELFISFRPF